MIDMSILLSQGLEQAINKALAPHIEIIERQNQTIFQLQTEIEAMQKKLDETSINELSLNNRVDELESQVERMPSVNDLFDCDEFDEAVRGVIRNAF